MSLDIGVFFDDYERGTLWGKDLYTYLTDVYQNKCKFCVMFISKDYAARVWTNLERQGAQARAMKENQEYILPARFDDTPVPGLLDTVGFIDLRTVSKSEVVDLISQKVGKKTRQLYLPPNLDRLFERLGFEKDYDSQAQSRAHVKVFFEVLRKMTKQERDAIITFILNGCPVELPQYIHINADFLRRLTGESTTTLQQLLGDVRSLGFESSWVDRTEGSGDMPGTSLGEVHMFYLKWSNLRGFYELPALPVVREMLFCAAEHYCEDHTTEDLDRLDFSQLARGKV